MRDIILKFLSKTGEVQDLRVFQSQTKKKSPIVFTIVENNCAGNVLMNRDEYQYFSDERLKVVVGALGLCSGNGPPWFEWGGPDGRNLTADRMLSTQIPGVTGKNCHFWLEDSQGHVFDCLPLYISETVARIHQKTINTESMLCDALIVSQSKTSLERAGLKYIPADIDEQATVIRHTMDRISVQQLPN